MDLPITDLSAWATETHYQGRGKFVGKGVVSSGRLFLAVQTHLSGHPHAFGQQLVHTPEPLIYRDGRALECTARVKINTLQRGLVFGFFLYNQAVINGVLRSDEIDFEWLTNDLTKLFVSTWRDWNRQTAAYSVSEHPVHGTQLTLPKNNPVNPYGVFADYTFRWSAGLLEFFVNGRLIHRFVGGVVPTRPMRLYLNAWVPDESWQEAFCPCMLPTSKAANVNHRILVERVRVNDVAV